MVLRFKRNPSDTSWSAISDGTLYVDFNNEWKPVINAKVNNGTSWVDTGYQGIPNPPSISLSGSWQSTFYTTTVTIAAPSTGPVPTSYTLYLYNENETSLLNSVTGTGTSLSISIPTFSTKYVLAVKSNLSSVQSLFSNKIRFLSGVAPFNYWDYPAGTSGTFRPTADSVTSTTSRSSNYGKAKAVDGDTSTLWVSNTRYQAGTYSSASAQTAPFEGFGAKIPATGGFDAYSKILTVKVSTVDNARVYVAFQKQDDTWVDTTGSTLYTPANIYMATSGYSNDTNYSPMFNHNYCMYAPSSTTSQRNWGYKPSYTYTLNVANFVSWHNSSYNSALKIGDIKTIYLAFGSLFSGLSYSNGSWVEGLDAVPGNPPYNTYHAGLYDLQVEYINRALYTNPGTPNTTW